MSMLSPYRVLDLSDERGQLCGQILGDLGADVVVVEPPGGSRSRSFGPYAMDDPTPERSLNFWAMNRDKRSVVADLETEAGRAQLRALAAATDFVIESYEPGVLDGLGLGWAALSAANPRLIMVSISAFGQSGPKAGWAASDITVLAASGTLHITGDDDRPPVRVTVPQAFLHGAAEGASAALIALAARERDGLGQHVDVSAQSAATMATQSMVLNHAWGEAALERLSGGIKLGPLQIRLVHPARDGFVSVSFFFGSAIGPFTRRLFEVMHERGFADEATRDKDWLGYGLLLASGEEPISELFRVQDLISEFTKAHTKRELFDLALERGLLIVPVATTADLLASEQLASRDYWTEVEHPELGRTVTYPGPFAKFSAQPLKYGRRPPLVGEHTAEVASEWGGTAPVTPAANVAETPRLPALHGLKVLDFMWVMAGPAGSRTLADYGATHVRVESTTRVDTARTLQPFKDKEAGPERSGLFGSLNAGKLGLTLNLSTEQGRATALKLAAWADVVLESYSPKAMKAWGLDYDSIRKLNPGVIMLSSCLNGQSGPHAGLAGFGTMGAQLAGFGEIAGWPDRPPAGPFGAYTDYIAPKYTAAAVLAALDHRRRTGEGQYIDLSQSEASFHFIGPAILDNVVNGRIARRAGNASPEFAPHGVYPCVGDDAWVAVAAETEGQWEALCRATGNTGWLTDERFATLGARHAHNDALDEAIGGWTVSRTADEIETTLQAAGVPVHRASTTVDVLADPQLAHRGHFVMVDHPVVGTVPVENARSILSATPAAITRAAPTYGQDNEYILRELLGLSGEEIVDLVAAGALD